MKNIILIIVMSFFGMNSFAQYREVEKVDRKKEGGSGKFQKENLFTGGTASLGFGNNVTILGIAPFFGYSVNRYLDVAFAPGISYISQRDYSVEGDKLRQKIYGPGAFVRVFPVKFLFAQAQYEFNLIRYKYIFPSNYGLPPERYKFDAHSLLVGGGFAGGRDDDNRSYYYISILWDVGNNVNSPYKDNLNRAFPIIRAGYNIALFQGR